MYSEDIEAILDKHKEHKYIKILMSDGNTIHTTTNEIKINKDYEDILTIQRPNEDYILFIDTIQIHKIIIDKKRRGCL